MKNFTIYYTPASKKSGLIPNLSQTGWCRLTKNIAKIYIGGVLTENKTINKWLYQAIHSFLTEKSTENAEKYKGKTDLNCKKMANC